MFFFCFVWLLLPLPFVVSGFLSKGQHSTAAPSFHKRHPFVAFLSTQPHPPLTEREIKTILDPIPIYAISSTQNDAILLVDDGNKNVGSFYLSKDHADDVAEQYSDVQVDAYSLGQVYFELFEKSASPTASASPVKVISTNSKDNEYRLVADPIQVDQAKVLLQQMPGVTEAAIKGFNEIPLFMDQRIRLVEGDDEEAEDYKEIFPIYFGWDDLMDTCEEYKKAYAQSGEKFEAAISVSDFFLVMNQMQEASQVDFRNVAMIPATPKPY